MKKEESDFGFTLEEDNKLKTVIEYKETDSKALAIYKIIKPLLVNLGKDEEKDVIKWPGVDRVKRINEVLSEIQKILGE